MRHKGFSVIEVMIAVVILSLAIVPFINVMSQNLRATTFAKKKYLAANYNKELIEEIKMKKFDETTVSAIGVDGAETQRLETGGNGYDDIDDYNGYDEGTLAGVMDISGVTENANFFRRVNVTYVSVTLSAITEIPATTASAIKRVTVTCFDRDDASGPALSTVETYFRP